MKAADPVPRVLLIEDYVGFADAVREMLRDACIIVWVTNVTEAEGLIRGDVDFAAVVIDCNLGRGTEEVVQFVRRVAPSFQKPFIACSGSTADARRLLTVGCTHMTYNKQDLPALLAKLLGLSL